MSIFRPHARIVLQASSLVLVTMLTGCGVLKAAKPPERVVFASFGAQPRASDEGAEPMAVAYAERRGDAVVTGIAVEGKALVVKGVMGMGRGSQWAGVGVTLGRDASMTVSDLSPYSRLIVRASSPTASALRVRVSSTDEKVSQMGCYPVYVVKVEPNPRDIEIPLSAFAPEAFCADNGRKIAPTLKAVRSLEVVDTALTNQPTSFSVERIEFVR